MQAPRGPGYGLGLDVLQTGLVLLPAGVIMLCLSPVSAPMSAAWGPKVTLAWGTAVIAVGYVLQINDSQYLWAIMAASPLARPPPPTASTSWPARSARP